MKLLIGGKNRNIHFRKDKSAFYKSNGEEHDVSKLFKKVGGGLKKQYEEYLVSDNDLTEKYKALNISGGSSSAASKKKPVHDKPINKKKRKGKKFVGGMSITSLNIDIDAAAAAGAADIDTRFRVYLKLIGAYYLALLTESDSFIFGDTPAQIKDFHKNKLNNLLIIDFMEKDAPADKYLPYADRINNLYFCQQLLKVSKVTAAPFDTGDVRRLLTNAALNPGGGVLVPGTKYDRFLVNPAPVGVGVVAPAPEGPDIITDMLGYRLPAYDVANNQIKAQFYRYIIADLTVLAGGGTQQPFIQSTLNPLPVINLEDGPLIAEFETNYVAVGGTVNLAILAATDPANAANAANADAIATYIGRNAVAAVAGGAAVAAVAAGNDLYTNELKKIPYQLLENLISNEIENDATNNPIASAAATFTTSLVAGITPDNLKTAYYNFIVEAANTAVTTAANALAPPAQRGTGLFALSIP